MRFRSHWTGRLTAVLVAATITAGGLAACSTPESDAGEATDSTEFTYWSMWREDEPVARVLQEAIAAFEAQSDIKVNVEWQGRDVLTKLKAALNTSGVPDLVDQGFPAMKAAIGSEGQAMDLKDVYDMPLFLDEGRTVRDAVPVSYDSLNSGDTRLMVPYNVSGSGIWFSGRDYPELVENPPKTWDEFTAAFAKVKANGQAPLAQDADLLAYGNAFVNAALVRALGVGNLNAMVGDHSAEGWDDPKVLKALSAIAELATDDDYIEGYDASKWPAMEKSWAAGNAAFFYMGGWVPQALGADLDADYDLHTFNFPTLAGTETKVPVNTYGYSIPSAAKHSDAAKKFITFVLSSEWLTKLAEGGQIITPDPTIEVPALLQDLKEMLNKNGVYLNEDGIVADYADLASRLAELNQKLIVGTITAKDYVTEAKAVQTQYWKLNG